MTVSTSLLNKHPLYTFIEQTFSNEKDPIPIPQTHKTLQISLKIFGILAAIAARISMVNVCLTAGQKIVDQPLDNPGSLTIGISNSIGTVFGSGLISVLTVNNLINAITRKLSREEHYLFVNNISKMQRNAIIMIALTGGILAQVPSAIGSYFGTVAPLPPALSAASQIADFSRPSYSIYHRLTELTLGSCNRCKSPHVRALNKFRDNVIKNIIERITLLDTDSLEARKLVSDIQELIEKNASGEEFFSAILGSPSESTASQIPLGIKIISKIFAIALLASYFMIAFEGLKILHTADIIFPLFAGILVVLANADILSSLTQTGLNHIYKLSSCRQNASYLKRASPKLHTALTITGTAISALPWAPSIYFAKEYFPKPLPLQFIAGVLSSIAVFLCSISATYAFRDKVIRRIIENNGADPILQMQDRLNAISSTLHKSSLCQIENLQASLPENMQRSLEPETSLNE